MHVFEKKSAFPTCGTAGVWDFLLLFNFLILFFTKYRYIDNRTNIDNWLLILSNDIDIDSFFYHLHMRWSVKGL